jgi:hypothetical protein
MSVIPDSLLVLGEYGGTFGSPVSITRAWNDRLAGTAFVEADPMVGYVIALCLDGPVTVGITEIEADGSWEITGIAEPYAGKELVILGIPRDTSTSFAIASRIKPV